MKKLLSSIAVFALCFLWLAPSALAEGEPSDAAPPSWEDLMGAIAERAKTSVEELTAATGAVHVNASASISIVPDKAEVSVGARIQEKSVQDAQAQANKVVSDIIEAVKALGVEENKITTSDYSVYPQTEYSSLSGEEKIAGYTVYNSITVQLEDFALLDSVIDAAIEKGANQINGISFDSSRRGELYREALKEAVQAAKEKAQLLAEASGVTLTSLKDVSEVSSINSSAYYRAANTAMDAAAAAGSAETSIQGGELAITAQVELTYEVKNIEK